MGQRDTPNPKAGQEGAADAIVIEQDDTTARRHERRQFFAFERAFRMNDDEGIRAGEAPELKPLGDNDPFRSQLFLRYPNELGQTLPVLAAWVEGSRARGARDEQRGKGRGEVDRASHLSCL
jgi:hypothetical protein